MAFFMNPGAMFLGCLGTSEQKFLVKLIETAAQSGYTRFVEPCAGTFAMANLAVQNGFKPGQIETSDVNMMSTVLGYAITGQPLESLEIHAQGFEDSELLDPATALYAQLYQQEQNQPPEPETAAGSEANEDSEEIPDEKVEAAKKRLGRGAVHVNKNHTGQTGTEGKDQKRPRGPTKA